MGSGGAGGVAGLRRPRLRMKQAPASSPEPSCPEWGLQLRYKRVPRGAVKPNRCSLGKQGDQFSPRRNGAAAHWAAGRAARPGAGHGAGPPPPAAEQADGGTQGGRTCTSQAWGRCRGSFEAPGDHVSWRRQRCHQHCRLAAPVSPTLLQVMTDVLRALGMGHEADDCLLR